MFWYSSIITVFITVGYNSESIAMPNLIGSFAAKSKAVFGMNNMQKKSSLFNFFVLF